MAQNGSNQVDPRPTRDVRRRHCVGGGAPVNFGRRRAAGPKKSALAARRCRPKTGLSTIPEKISFYPLF